MKIELEKWIHLLNFAIFSVLFNSDFSRWPFVAIENISVSISSYHLLFDKNEWVIQDDYDFGDQYTEYIVYECPVKWLLRLPWQKDYWVILLALNYDGNSFSDAAWNTGRLLNIRTTFKVGQGNVCARMVSD